MYIDLDDSRDDDRRSVSLSALLIIALIFGCTCGLGLLKSTRNTGAAETEAKRWALELDLEVERVTCNAVDSDGDGYVACSVKLRGELHPLQLECAGALNLQHGCREQKVHVAR